MSRRCHESRTICAAIARQVVDHVERYAADLDNFCDAVSERLDLVGSAGDGELFESQFEALNADEMDQVA